MIRYIVEQGIFKESGSGDFTLTRAFNFEDDARKYYESIKDDRNGYSKKGDVITQLISYDDEKESYEVIENYSI